jgi:hypothetical protein
MLSMEQLVRMAAAGHKILIIRSQANQLSCQVNSGALFIRSFSESGLKSVSIDTLVLVGCIPIDVREVAMQRLAGHLETQVFEVRDL